MPLDRDKFKLAYVPDQGIETGLEQKIGRHVPFFQEGDHWPVTGDIYDTHNYCTDDIPLSFVMQFIDPRPGKLISSAFHKYHL